MQLSDQKHCFHLSIFLEIVLFPLEVLFLKVC